MYIRHGILENYIPKLPMHIVILHSKSLWITSRLSLIHIEGIQTDIYVIHNSVCMYIRPMCVCVFVYKHTKRSEWASYSIMHANSYFLDFVVNLKHKLKNYYTVLKTCLPRNTNRKKCVWVYLNWSQLLSDPNRFINFNDSCEVHSILMFLYNVDI